MNYPQFLHQFYDRVPEIDHDTVIGHMRSRQAPAVPTSSLLQRLLCRVGVLEGKSPEDVRSSDENISLEDFAQLRLRLRDWFRERLIRLSIESMSSAYDELDDVRRETEAEIISGIMALDSADDPDSFCSPTYGQERNNRRTMSLRDYAVRYVLQGDIVRLDDEGKDEGERPLVEEACLTEMYRRIDAFMKELVSRVQNSDYNDLVSSKLKEKPEGKLRDRNILDGVLVGYACSDEEAEVTARIFARERQSPPPKDVEDHLVAYAKFYAEILRARAPRSIFGQRLDVVYEDADMWQAGF